MENFDIIILGAGPAGAAAALKARKLGKSALCVDSGKIGGTCLNRGCIPTKALLRSAEVWELARACCEFGVFIDGANFDFSKVRARAASAVERLAKGLEFSFKQSGAKFLSGAAKIVSANAVEVQTSDGQRSVFGAQKILIATGSRPKRLKFLDYSSPRILDSSKALALESVPQKVLIVGAGAIGVEFASIWSAFGAEVTLAEMKNCMLPNEDADCVRALERSFRRRSVKIKTGTALKSAFSDEVCVRAVLESKGAEETVEAEFMLVCAGVEPNSENIADAVFGLKKCPRGFIETDENFKTSVENIYAAGDVRGKNLLAHSASFEAERAVEIMFGAREGGGHIPAIPFCAYSFPQVAGVGETEESARAKYGERVRTAKVQFMANGKAAVSGDTEGLVKLICLEDGRLLGARIAGAAASEMISVCALALSMGATVKDLADCVLPHPTFSEAISDCAKLLI